MLFVAAEFSKPKRIQGAYASEEEVQKVVNFIVENNQELTVKEGINFESEEIESFISTERNEDDELLDEAIEIIWEAKKASASLLQRHLKLGYARAARILDILEAKGLIGPGIGAKPREIHFEKIKALRKDFPSENNEESYDL